MTEKGYKGGLVSRIRNLYSGKKYTISTAREIGKDYWTSVVASSKFFGLWLDWSNRLTIVRNNKEDAYGVHEAIKKVVGTAPEKDWIALFPDPRPPGGYSEEAKELFRKRSLIIE
jgi:hypothetical protein